MHSTVHTSSTLGHWSLNQGHALTLRPTTDGELRIAQGQVWASFSGPHLTEPGVRHGDLIVGANESIDVKAGQSIVLEVWDAHQPPALFDWMPSVTALPTAQAQSPAQAWRDLRAALGGLAVTFGRLIAGLGRPGVFLRA